MLGNLFRIAIALGAFVLIMKVGIAVLRGLAQPIPEPLPAGELRKVKILFRCTICGAEVRMQISPTEEPQPPRHCMEDMVIVAPAFE